MFMIKDIIVSDSLFTEYFQCDLASCKGACCREGDYGAPLTHGEIREIEKVLDKVLPLLPAEQQEKIEKDGFTHYYHVEEEGNLQSGATAGSDNDFIGTALMQDGSCVFAVHDDKGVTLCALESLYLAGKTDWKKPVSCELFPVRVNKSEIRGFEALNYYEWDICKAACKLGEKNKMPVFKFVKNALIRKYGEDFYHEMELAYENFISQKGREK